MSYLFKIFVVLLLLASPAHAVSDIPGANKFVRSVSDRTLAIVISSSFSEKEKEKKLENLFSEAVDSDWIAKFALGRYWRAATDLQKSEYQTVYRKYLFDNYIPKFKKYTNQQFVLKSTLDDGNGEYLVKTEIKNPAGVDIRVDYKIRMQNGVYKIFDIVAEGVSLIATQRSDFSSILSRKGVDVLIKKLKAKSR